MLGQPGNHVGATWGHLGPKLEPLGGSLGAMLAQLGVTWDPSLGFKGNENQRFFSLFSALLSTFLGPPWDHLGAKLEPLGANLGAMLGHLRAPGGTFWRPSGPQLPTWGAKWSRLAPHGGPSGAVWLPMGSQVEPFGSPWGAMWSPLAPHGQPWGANWWPLGTHRRRIRRPSAPHFAHFVFKAQVSHLHNCRRSHFRI